MGRAVALLAMLLATTMGDGRAAVAAGREWLVQVGSGVQGASDAQLQGGCVTAAALTPIRPWLLLGGEAAWYEMPAGLYASDVDVVGADQGYERSRAVTGTLTGRFQFPVQGFSPFLLAEAGIGGIDLGDRWWTSSGAPPRGTVPGESSFMWVAGAGMGLRLTAARPWPDMEASVRTAAWTSARLVFNDGTPTSQVGSLRVALTW